jgi:hypothetical protein
LVFFIFLLWEKHQMAGVKGIFDQKYVVVLISYQLEASADQIFVGSLELPKKVMCLWICYYKECQKVA